MRALPLALLAVCPLRAAPPSASPTNTTAVPAPHLYCGDGHKGADEQCDDGNTNGGGDGCGAACAFEQE
eukprot:gene49749-55816_t